ncbi:SusD/RagB family nutrient-binding outer membrane lipoprotein [Flavimarina sp. Hel_I_48]|uniref:SusD/RagB family nutrient-binding outer membrane lipoprotein n=1 Tax=Flavimarina sp. Hel_I_48 TaxID=1392488 RepID=UPI00068E20E3|nr:SusD/RagB family nutrient-binding outer membrane lipoprotein [Flavimarina sp. Hel_I_48]
MKKVNIYAIAVLSLLVFSGCDDYLGDNLDPNQELEENLSPSDLLPTSIVYTSSGYYNIGVNICQYSQQIASYFQPGADTQEEIQITGGWSFIYLQALPDIQTMEELAVERNSTSYQGIAKILQATNLGLATDQWGAIPTSAATLGEEDFTPTFESQENVYTFINTLLDDAIALLEQDDTSGLTVGEDDLIYGGDLSKWIKTAYFLKAKYALHTTEIDQNAAVTAVLAAYQNAFTSNDDDYQLVYNTRNFNPWYAGVVLPNATGNASVLLSDQLISLMDGTQFPFDGIDQDPRLPLITTLGSEETQYLGAINGSAGIHAFGATDDDPNVGATTDFGATDFYSSQTAPVLIGSFSELKFMQAEALFLQNGGGTNSTGTTAAGYAAYLDGIRANFDKIGVDAAARDAYLADASVAVGANNLTLALLMREKYIATFLNPESFVDLRRYDFNPEVFAGLALPVNHNEILNNQWVRRAQYPATEQTRNGEEVERVIKGIGEGVWWDKD